MSNKTEPEYFSIAAIIACLKTGAELIHYRIGQRQDVMLNCGKFKRFPVKVSDFERLELEQRIHCTGGNWEYHERYYMWIKESK